MLFSAFEQYCFPAVVYSFVQRSSIFSACPLWNTEDNISQNIERLCSTTTARNYYLIIFIFSYMYWTDWGHFPRIERAYMNGENREDLVNKTLGRPNGLALDHVYNKLYWTDTKRDSLEVMDLETRERQVVLYKNITICK